MSEPPQSLVVSDDDEDDIALPDDTLAILQSFLAEKSQREKLAETDSSTQGNPTGEKPTFDAFEENWVSISKI